MKIRLLCGTLIRVMGILYMIYLVMKIMVRFMANQHGQLMFLHYGQAGLIVGTAYTTEFDLEDNTRYFWQVTATDQSGATYETTIQSFIVNQENDNPEEFALLVPENEEMVTDLTPPCYWDVPVDPDDARSRTIESYFLYYGTGIEDLTVEFLTDNSFTPIEPLVEDTIYFWKVVHVMMMEVRHSQRLVLFGQMLTTVLHQTLFF